MTKQYERACNDLRGLGTALVTPFTAEGRVDFEALGKLLDMQLGGAVDYIVVLGTTGEAATLCETERLAVREFIVRKVAGRLPLVLGVGGNCTAAVVEQLHELHDTLLRDFTAILSVCPYYNKPSQEGLYQHFCTIAEASPIPVLLYNVPGRTGVNMLPETVLRIHAAQPEKVCGVKEASGKVEQIEQLIHEAPADFSVISGDDGIACELMEAGAAGLISVASNAFPEAFHRLVHEKNRDIQAEYAEMVRLLFGEGNPSGIKTVLAEQGLIGNYLRLPLVPNSANMQEKIRKALAELR